MRIVPIGANPQNAARLHRFEAIFDQVVKRLLHLVAVELEQRQIRTQLLLDHDVAVFDFGREKAHRFFDNRVHIFRMQLWSRRPNRAEKLTNDGIEPVYFGARDFHRFLKLGMICTVGFAGRAFDQLQMDV